MIKIRHEKARLNLFLIKLLRDEVYGDFTFNEKKVFTSPTVQQPVVPSASEHSR